MNFFKYSISRSPKIQLVSKRRSSVNPEEVSKFARIGR